MDTNNDSKKDTDKKEPVRYVPPSTYCKACGIDLQRTLGLVCTHPDCPTGLSGPQS